MNKRGSLLDGVFIIVVIILFLAASLVAVTILSNFMNNPAIRVESQKSSAGNITYNQSQNLTSSGFDNMFVAMYFGLHILMIVLAAVIPINAVFFVLNLVFMIVLMVIGLMLQRFGEQLVLGFGLASGVTKMLFITRHAFVLELAFAIITIIVMFMASKARE